MTMNRYHPSESCPDIRGESSSSMIPEADALPTRNTRERSLQLFHTFPNLSSSASTTKEAATKTLECSHTTVETVTSSLASIQLLPHNFEDDEADDDVDNNHFLSAAEDPLHSPKNPLPMTMNRHDYGKRNLLAQALADDHDTDEFAAGEGIDPRAQWSLQAARHLTLTFDKVPEEDDTSDNHPEEEEEEDPRKLFTMRREESLHQSGNLLGGWEEEAFP